MPTEIYLNPMQGSLVQTFVADWSVRPHRFASIMGPMRVGLTRAGMIGIGLVVSPSPKEGGPVLVQSTGVAKVLVDHGEVFAGDPVCVGPEGGVMPIAANRQSVGIAAENGLKGDIIRVLLNISPNFELPSQSHPAKRLANARRLVGGRGKDGEGRESGAVKRKRYVSLDG